MDSALIAVIGAVVGILLSNGIKLVLDARGRTERVRDIQTALRAEIRSHRQALEVFLDEERGIDVIEQIATDLTFSPFVPREVDPFIFDAVVGDINVLPSRVIDPLVLYYRQWRTLAGSSEDMRQSNFLLLAPQRKAAIYADYLAVGRYATELANDAIKSINVSLNDQNGGEA